MSIVNRINEAYLQLEESPFANIGGVRTVFHDGIDAILAELCARPILTFEETMISAAKSAASSEDKCYSVRSVQNILRLMAEPRVFEAYRSDFKNTRKEIRRVLDSETEKLAAWQKKHPGYGKSQ